MTQNLLILCFCSYPIYKLMETLELHQNIFSKEYFDEDFCPHRANKIPESDDTHHMEPPTLGPVIQCTTNTTSQLI